ncbi:peptidase M16 [Acinetobacter sp. ANC 3903]|uniref:M16 family metallopeptidase n=1 Tax=Acinetobacter sp. ANC 3903 TaxID=1977883 RepID=UPI000B5618E1|nr:pitrilysin family protein [Acinetobacter sp. ANC 3903]OTG63972.1 peptidase M16 [Acinetobacter sp. ANC 3903]
MIKLHSFLIFSCMSWAQAVMADVDLDTIPDDNPTQLTSILLLQSLKTANKQSQFYAPYVHELKNKYKVRTLFVESADLPMVDVQLTFNAGSARDEEIAPGLYGIANMAAKLIDEGTENYTANEIANAFESVGARFSAQAYRDMFIVKLRVLSDPQKLEPALAMMMELLKHASFEKSRISLVLSNTQVGQKQIQESPSRMMSVLFYRALYGKHAYAEPISGTQHSISKITPAQLRQFSDQFLVAQNLNIAITGQLSSKQAQQLSERIAGNLKQGEKAKPLAQPVDKSSFDIRHIKFNSTQAHVMMGQLGPSRFDPDRLALEVANQMFGGSGFNSILMKELRVKRGLSYGAYSSFSFSQAPGTFSFSYSTRQDQLLDSLKVAHQALVNFVQQPIDQKQLEETKAGMLRAFPNNYSSNANINAQLGSIGFYNQPADYLSHYPKLLEKITAQDVQNAIQKHLHPERLTIIVVNEKLDKIALEAVLKQDLNPQTPKNIPTIKQNPETIIAPVAEAVTDAPVSSPTDAPASI